MNAKVISRKKMQEFEADAEKLENFGGSNPGHIGNSAKKNKNFVHAVPSGNQDYSNMAGETTPVRTPQGVTQAATFDPDDAPITIKISNKNTQDIVPVKLFGAVLNGAPGISNYGNTADIVITLGSKNLSYAQLLELLKSSAIHVNFLRVEVTTNLQYSNEISMRTTGINNGWIKSLHPHLARSKDSFKDDFVDMSVNLQFDNMTELEVDLQPSENVVFTFFVNSRINLGNVLTGNTALEVNPDVRR